jgi:hypothetical protein
MMTEKSFWDMFNKKHNPRYYYATKKTKEEKTKSKKKDSKHRTAKRYSLRESKGGVG